MSCMTGGMSSMGLVREFHARRVPSWRPSSPPMELTQHLPDLLDGRAPAELIRVQLHRRANQRLHQGGDMEEQRDRLAGEAGLYIHHHF